MALASCRRSSSSRGDASVGQGGRRHGAIALLVLSASPPASSTAGVRHFPRLLDSPGTDGDRNEAAGRTVATARCRGCRGAAPPWRMAHMRLALRTPRGRSIVLSPLMVFVVFAVVMYRQRTDASSAFVPSRGRAESRPSVAVVCLLADPAVGDESVRHRRSGLTLALLSPLDEGPAEARRSGMAFIGA